MNTQKGSITTAVIIAVVVGIIIAAGGLIAVKSSNTADNQTSSDAAVNQTPMTDTKASARKSVKRIYMISLEKDKANPDILVVPVGSFIQINSRDGLHHNIDLGHGNGFGDKHEHEIGLGSGDFGTDEAYRLQIKKIGIYDFHDHYHPDIHLTIIGK